MSRRLISAWSEVLDIDESEIDEDDNFFEIGGDSVTSMRLIGAVRERCLQIDAEDIFRHPTLSQMEKQCKGIEEAHGPGSSSETAVNYDLMQQCALACQVDPTFIEDIVASPKMQARLFQLHISAKAPGAMLEQVVFEIEGTDDTSTVMAAFQAVQKNNQILRTRLIQHEDQVLQVILRQDQIHWAKGSNLAEYLKQDISIRANFGDPLIRYAVVHEHEKTFIVWTAQHCVEDEWTRHLLLDEIEQYLLSPTTSRRELKSPSSRLFADYMSSRLKDGAAFWQTYMGDSARRRGLWTVPEGYTSGSMKFLAGERREISYNSQEHGGISLAMVAHGAFGLAFAAMSGNLDDSVFLTVRMGRQIPLKGIESIMGPMLCTVPMRVQPTSHDTVLGMLQQIQEDTISMMPYEQLAGETIPSLTNSRPIFNWHMNHINVFERSITFESGGSKCCLKPNGQLTPPSLLELPFYVSGRATKNGVSVRAGCDHSLVDESLLRRFVDCFLHILELMVRRSLQGTVQDVLAAIDVKSNGSVII
ncbi:MAG: hypothetical protein Q9213_001625 [Squamulea squamosa]